MPASAAARYVTKFSLDPDRPPDVGGDGRAFVDEAACRAAGRRAAAPHRRIWPIPVFPTCSTNCARRGTPDVSDRIGVSVYDLDDLERSVDAFPDLDLLQFPGSVVDTRLLDHPLVARAARIAGWNARSRSVFLQGLLLQPADDLPARFRELAPVVRALDDVAGRHGVDRLTVAPARAFAVTTVAGVVVGADVGRGARARSPAPGRRRSPRRGRTVSVAEDVLDPRRWSS